MASLGITENFDQSLRLMCRKLSLRIAPNIEAWNVTDRLFEVDTRFRKVESVQRTARLEAAMSDLVAYDSELYRYAVQDFDSRCAEACKSRSAC